MSRTYAIADLHGRFDLLCDAISAVEADPGEAGGTLVCMGDFVDRGPQARSIIELFMAGPSLPNWEWVVLQGNHEEMMLRALAHGGRHLLPWWIRNGGGATLQSYGYADGQLLEPLKVPASHRAWLKALPIYHEDDHRIFVHAGVPPYEHVADVKPAVLQWMLYGDEQYFDATVIPDEPHISGKHVVHGHHQSATHPLLKRHRTNLDSFAWHTGRLAIGVFDDTQARPIHTLEVCRPVAAAAA